MFTVRTAIIACAALVAGSGIAAEAADLNFRGTYRGGYKGTYQSAAAPRSRSWYLRGDVTYGAHVTPHLLEQSSTSLLSNSSISDAWSGGYGIGYNINRNVRTDFTFDLREEVDVTGTRRFAASTGRRDFEIKSSVFLANVYYDLGDRDRFTPYIGLGLGVARHNVKAGHVIDSSGASGRSQAHANWTMAAALMAGASANLSNTMGLRIPGLHLDAGYRYLILGSTETGTLNGPTGLIAGKIDIDDFAAHEFRFGVRYEYQ